MAAVLDVGCSETCLVLDGATDEEVDAVNAMVCGPLGVITEAVGFGRSGAGVVEVIRFLPTGRGCAGALALTAFFVVATTPIVAIGRLPVLEGILAALTPVVTLDGEPGLPLIRLSDLAAVPIGIAGILGTSMELVLDTALLRRRWRCTCAALGGTIGVTEASLSTQAAMTAGPATVFRRFTFVACIKSATAFSAGVGVRLFRSRSVIRFPPFGTCSSLPSTCAICAAFLARVTSTASSSGLQLRVTRSMGTRSLLNS